MQSNELQLRHADLFDLLDVDGMVLDAGMVRVGMKDKAAIGISYIYICGPLMTSYIGHVLFIDVKKYSKNVGDSIFGL